MYIGIYVKCFLLLSGFRETLIFSLKYMFIK